MQTLISAISIGSGSNEEDPESRLVEEPGREVDGVLCWDILIFDVPRILSSERGYFSLVYP
mgnify:CR=1 FL=1